MSDHWLRFAPVDPSFQPSVAASKTAERLLAAYLPEADNIRSEFTAQPAFIDPGGNWSGVLCSACGEDAEPWWSAAVSAAFEADFSNLTVRAACCGAAVSLNDLRYLWPAAFARYVLEAMNPNVKALSASQLERLASTIGCDIREISAHL